MGIKNLLQPSKRNKLCQDQFKETITKIFVIRQDFSKDSQQKFNDYIEIYFSENEMLVKKILVHWSQVLGINGKWLNINCIIFEFTSLNIDFMFSFII